jgi:beta-glucanase (GH16 family)
MNFLRTLKVGSVLTLTVAGLFGQTPPPSGTVILRDDFNGSSLDATKWSLGTWKLGRTQLGNAPVVTGGYARLKFDTFNPGDSGRSFRGTEIYSKLTFDRETGGGSGIEIEASVRVNAMPGGLVTSLFTYVSREEGTVVLSDEIDFEFLSKQIASSTTSDPVLATTWNDWNNSTEIYTDPNTYSSQSIILPGLKLDVFNKIVIRWLTDRVEWLVNGVLIRTAMTAVPDARTNVRLNFWAPASGWTDAYSNKLVPAKNARQNQTYYYDVDYVEVRRLP